MPTRHRNSKSHKKSVRNRGQKGGAKLEKNNVKLKDIPDIKDLDGAIYTQDLRNKHSYKIRVFKSNMTYDDFTKEVDYDITTDTGSNTTFIKKINDKNQILKNNNNTLQIKEQKITGFTLLWNFKDSKVKIETPIKISVPFYDNPVDIKLDQYTKCILFNSSNIYIFKSTIGSPSVDTTNAGSDIQQDKIVEYYKSQAFGIKTAIGKAATAITNTTKNIGDLGTSIGKKVREGYDYIKEDKGIGTTLKNKYQGVMSADLTGACNRCKYTFSQEEKEALKDIVGDNSSQSFTISLKFNDNQELELVNQTSE